MEKQFKRILAVGGTHGDEPTGVAVVEELIKEGIDGIDGLIANPEAVLKNMRFVETDLNRSFGVASPLSMEERRAKEIVPYLHDADLIIEFHDTYAENNTCAIVTGSLNPIQQMLAEFFQMSRVVIMPLGGSLGGQNPSKTLSLEISRSEAEIFSVDLFLLKLRSINRQSIDKLSPGAVYECLPNKVLRSTAKNLGLKFEELRNFEELTAEQVRVLKLGQAGIYVPMFIGEKAYGEEFGFQIGRKIS